MDGTAPSTRLVRCPRCRSVLPEVTGVPLYQCAVCETILLAKSFRSQGTSMASVDSPFNFSHSNEFDHGFETGSSISNSESVGLGADRAQSRDAGNAFNSDNGYHNTGNALRNEGNKGGDGSITNENHCHSTDAENNSTIEDGCLGTKEITKNGQNESRSEKGVGGRENGVCGSENGVGDEVLDSLGKQTTQDLNMQARDNMNNADSASSEHTGNDPNIKDGCLETTMNLKNGENVNKSESGVGDEVLDSLGEQTTPDLNFQNHGTEIKDDPIRCVESETGNDEVRRLDGQLEKKLILEDVTKLQRFKDNEEEFVESSMQKPVSDENQVDGDINNEASGRAISPTNAGSPAYEGSVSSFDGRYEKSPGTQYQLQSRTLRFRSVTHSPLSDHVLRGASQEALHKTTHVTERHKMQYVSDFIGSYSSVESPSHYDRHSHGQEYSAHSAKEQLQNGLSSSPLVDRNDSPSSKFRDIEHSRMELLRKVDDLRSQIIESLDKTSDVDRKSQMMGSRQAWQSSLLTSLGSLESEHDELLVPSHPTSRSKQSPIYCLNCRAIPPQGISCNNGLCMSCCHMCCHPSNTADYHTHVLSSPLSSSKSFKHNNVVRLYPKRDQTAKRHCRPISGGANFIICPGCLALLQMPDDFNFSISRRNKLRCGSCSQVLTVTFPKRKHHSHIFKGNGGAPYFTYNEEYVPSSSGSFAMENEQALYRSVNSIDSRPESHLNQQARLHQLMGYCSARDIILQPSDCEECRSRAEITANPPP